MSIIMVIVALSGSFNPRAGYAEGEEIVLSMSGYHQTTSYTCGSASSLMVLYYCGAKEALLKDGITNDKKFHEKFSSYDDVFFLELILHTNNRTCMKTVVRISEA